MSWREKKVKFEGAPTVEIQHNHGRYTAKVSASRRNRNGDWDQWEMTFDDLDTFDLRCIVKSIRRALRLAERAIAAVRDEMGATD